MPYKLMGCSRWLVSITLKCALSIALRSIHTAKNIFKGILFREKSSSVNFFSFYRLYTLYNYTLYAILPTRDHEKDFPQIKVNCATMNIGLDVFK